VTQENTATAGIANTADVHQFSASGTDVVGNNATIDQGPGRSFSAIINQGTGATDSEPGAPAGNNTATVSQVGSGGNEILSVSTFIDQQSEGSTADVIQSGVDGASVVINQTGFAGALADANRAEVSQVGGSGLSVSLVQRNNGAGGDNDAIIIQDGYDLSVTSSQVDDNNQLDIDQSGWGNAIVTSQQDDTGQGRNEIGITQTGEGNTVYSAQTDAPSSALIDQSGFSNEIVTAQDASGANNSLDFENSLDIAQSGGNNTIYALQRDDGNVASIDQSGWDNAINLEQTDNFDGGLNDATLSQASDVTFSTINAVQDDSENTLFVGQSDGTYLTANVQQSGALGFNDATLTQSGAYNTTDISQTSTFGGETNTINFDQSGAGNLAQLEQIGGDNGINASQSGWLNVLQISQDGSGNSASGSQSGESNSLTIVSEGYGNEVTFTQASYGNKGSIHQDGSENTAELSQTTAANSAHIFQTGYGNSATVTQDVGNTQNALVVQNGFANHAHVSQ